MTANVDGKATRAPSQIGAGPHATADANSQRARRSPESQSNGEHLASSWLLVRLPPLRPILLHPDADSLPLRCGHLPSMASGGSFASAPSQDEIQRQLILVR